MTPPPPNHDNLHLLYTTQDEMELVVLKKLAVWVLFKSLHQGYSPEDKAVRTREGIEDEIFILTCWITER